jgi:hypothetical protein
VNSPDSPRFRERVAEQVLVSLLITIGTAAINWTIERCKERRKTTNKRRRK